MLKLALLVLSAFVVTGGIAIGVRSRRAPEAPASASVEVEGESRESVPELGARAPQPEAPQQAAPRVPTPPKRNAPTTITQPPVTAKQVIINGRVFSVEQVAELEETYGVRPVAGRYWYDSVSGLFGIEGQGSAGFMLPGHDFGALAANASRGNTRVFFNGREITRQELAIIESITGQPGQPGRYWFDAAGNVGVEGIPIPLVNLYALANSRGVRGGDNFWSSRFSAGNFYTDASGAPSQGYVSVPGYGPVGYGL